MIENASFEDFFEAVHGFVPFSWQRELVHEVVDLGGFPELINLPTGSGKTAILDIALYAMASEATKAPDERRMPRRIVYVVDRRLIVDQVNGHGKQLLSKLDAAATQPPGGSAGAQRALDRINSDRHAHALTVVAEHLRALAAPGIGTADRSQPLPVVQQAHLRGGITRDESWATRPDLPTLITSTVDQVGSRLLFRGYGISPRSLPVHAGLLADDCLFVLDEVHLSQQFAHTLTSIGEHIATASQGLGTVREPRWSVTQLSATPPEDPSIDRFPRTPLRSDTVPDPVLAQRLEARKPVRLTAAKAPLKNSDGAMAKALCTEAKNLIADLTARSDSSDTPETDRTQAGPGGTNPARERSATLAAVVTNRVATAVAVAQRLEQECSKPRSPLHDFEIVLITGRMRPVDRDRLVDHKMACWTDRDQRSSITGPGQIIVATQCIEAGVDMDLDVLVSECASSDALRQRFGRLDRKGHMQSLGLTARGSVVLRGTRPPDDDPVYGEALAKTWEWLNSISTLDFGIEFLPEPPRNTKGADSPAPLLTSVHLDTLVQTSPVPVIGPEVSRWLHGDRDPETDVQVIWRRDLEPSATPGEPADTKAGGRGDAAAATGHYDVDVQERVKALPPRAREALSVPISAVKAWLTPDDAQVEVADVDGVADSGPSERRSRKFTKWFVRWRSDDDVAVLNRWDVRPGDTIVVPAGYGGITKGTWDPSSPIAVSDVADQVAQDSGAPLVVRFHPGIFPQVASGAERLAETTQSDSRNPQAGAAAATSAIPDQVDESEDPREVLLKYISQLLDQIPDGQDHQSNGPLAPSPFNVEVLERIRELRWKDVRSLRCSPTGGSTSYVVEARGLWPHAERPTDVSDIDTGAPGDLSSITETKDPVLLAEHLRNVGEVAGRFGRALGWPAGLADDLTLAGQLHDLGKADPRFQILLGNDLAGKSADTAVREVTIDIADCWAKSTSGIGRLQADQRAADTQYPRGQRHEMLSAAMIQGRLDVLERAHDPDLVLYLVLSHHGFGRPFAPPVRDDLAWQVNLVTSNGPGDTDDLRDSVGDLLADEFSANSDHQLAEASSFVAPLFWRLVQRYGHFRLAHIEALFRTADQTHSALEKAGQRVQPLQRTAGGNGDAGTHDQPATESISS